MDNNGQPDALLYEEGSLIAERYYIQRSFSSGGQGEIYLCLDMKDLVPLILKTPRPDSEGVGRKLEDLETEVINWIELGVHPNVVECRYVDIIDNRPFIVLEPVINEDGIVRTLSDWICEHGTLGLRQALDFSIDICRGLLYVKTSNPSLAHQDLKPQNVLIGVEDIAKITDFGPGVSLPYMAPEQFTDPNIRHKQADIYAFGCILYEMLNGAPPFGFGTEKQGVRYFRRQHAEADIPSLSQYPDALNLLIHKCLAKNMQDRFQDLSILLSDLITLYGQQFGVEPRPLKTSH